MLFAAKQDKFENTKNEIYKLFSTLLVLNKYSAFLPNLLRYSRYVFIHFDKYFYCPVIYFYILTA